MDDRSIVTGRVLSSTILHNGEQTMGTRTENAVVGPSWEDQ